MPIPRSGSAQDARAAALRALCAETFDVLVIGGGITGAGTARDAAMRGLRVALVEQSDFASGTSSRSSRIVHGGIRYLEQGQLRMVRESSREKKILLEIAPHLVRRLPFTWPVYKADRISRWKINLGLALYDRLAGDAQLWRHESLDSRDVLDREPMLTKKNLTGGAGYFDAATDDSRLTLANILSARIHGAIAANYVQAVKTKTGKPNTVRVRDELTSIEFEVRARAIVEAIGPWASPKGTSKSRGTHIAVPRNLIGNTDALTLLSPVDGRVMFVLPSGDFTIVGTTDIWTTDSPESVCASRRDVDYLLRSARAYFPEHFIGEDQVVSAWAGLRPLATENTRGNPSAVSREHQISRDKSGIVRVSGGKLTTYRSMASEICDHVQRVLGQRPRVSRTDNELLPGGERKENLVELTTRNSSLSDPISDGRPELMAEVQYAVSNEHAQTLSDILFRRTRIAFETADHGREASAKIADFVSALLGWSKKEKSDQLRRYVSDTDRMFRIGPD